MQAEGCHTHSTGGDGGGGVSTGFPSQPDPEFPVQTSSSCFLKTREGSLLCRDGSAVRCQEQIQLVPCTCQGWHCFSPRGLQHRWASDVGIEARVSRQLQEIRRGGEHRGLPVLSCEGAGHRWSPRQQGRKPWKPWRQGRRLLSLDL